MALLEIVEYARLARDQDGNVVMAGREPAVTQQQVNFAGGSTQSAIFNRETRIIMVRSDVAARLDFGANPTASSTDARYVDASRLIFFGVDAQAGNLRLAVIAA